MVAVSAMAMCAFGLAAPVHNMGRLKVTPVLYTGPVVPAVPTYIQKVITYDNGKHVIPLGPQIPYVPSNFKKMLRSTYMYDTYEGVRTTSANDNNLTSDGQYGTRSFPCPGASTGVEGSSWVFSVASGQLEFPNTISHMVKTISAGGGTYGWLDTRVFLSSDSTPVSDMFVFTYNDNMSEIQDQSAFVFAATTPASGNAGVRLTFATPLAAGTSYRINTDVSSLALAMPSSATGWVQQIFAAAVDPNTNAITYASHVQPLWWGTQGINKSFQGRDLLANSDGTTASDTTWYNWDFGGYYAMPTSSTVNRGLGAPYAGNVANLKGTAGTNEVITQKRQAIASANNAELEVVCTLDPAGQASTLLNQIRPVVVAKANNTGSGTPTMTVSMKNVVSGLFENVRTGPPVTGNFPGGTDGDYLNCVSPTNYLVTGYTPSTWGTGHPELAPYDSLSRITDATGTVSNWIADDGAGNRTVTVRVAAKQPAPALAGWKLTVNMVYVEFDEFGPDNLGPRIALSGSSL